MLDEPAREGATVSHMITQTWVRNPYNYIREVLEVGHTLIAWDRGVLAKRRLDPNKFADLYYGGLYWRALAIGDQGAAEVDSRHTLQKPAAVYPVWQYGDSIAELEDMLERPVGEDVEACEDENIPADERPVLGQEHRVVIIGIPSLATGPGRSFLRVLSDLQDEYPSAVIHLHGLYSWRAMYGNNFKSVDIDPRTLASKGEVMLPNGKYVTYERAAAFPQWVTVLGYKPVDLEVPRNRCMYNIKSALWAAKHFKENLKFKSTGPVASIDTSTPDATATPALAQWGPSKNSPAQEGDKLLCEACSLQNDCKYYREGSVCSVPGSEPARLASFFNTRDPERVIDGLTVLLSTQSNRVERGLTDEHYGEELDPHVSTLINSLFANGVKLVKLLDPKRSGGTQVGVFVNGGSAQVSASSPQQLTAAIVAELESKGISRENITPDMIARMLDPGARQTVAIEARTVSDDVRDGPGGDASP
jgi:hypothetical protein